MTYIYQDNLVEVKTPEKPACKGHVKLTTTADNFLNLTNEEFSHMITSASFASTSLFEVASAHGTNIVLSDLHKIDVDILARMQDDGITLQWDPQQLLPQEMDEIAEKIKDKCDYILPSDQQEQAPKEQQEQVVQTLIETPQEELETSEKEEQKNYLHKQLDRIP